MKSVTNLLDEYTDLKAVRQGCKLKESAARP
jgi:hypothetical protein